MDTKIIEKIHPDVWRNGHLSIARFYGGIKIQGVYYILCPESDYLIREDIWKQELKQKKIKEAEKRKWEKAKQLKINKW